MQENHCILVNSTKHLLLSYSKSEFFYHVNLSKPTHILYGSGVGWSNLEADVIYIKKFIKGLHDILSFRKQFRDLILVSVI